MFDGKYQSSPSRANPGCILFVLDQSFSMNEGIAGSSRPKAEALATAINRFLNDLIIRCERGEDKPRHYFDIGVIGYTTTQSDPPVTLVGPVLQGELAGRDVVSVVDLSDFPLEVQDRQKDDGAGGLMTIKFPVWYKAPEPNRMGGTPMKSALEYVHGVASAWCAEHPGSHPPVVIHLTDGESNDGDPEPSAEALRSLQTEDGGLLLLNCHLSASPAPGVIFPTTEDQLPDEYSRLLFRMSSQLPPEMRKLAEVMGINVPTGARGMVFNADGTQLLLLIKVGTVIGGEPPNPEPSSRSLVITDQAAESMESEWASEL